MRRKRKEKSLWSSTGLHITGNSTHTHTHNIKIKIKMFLFCFCKSLKKKKKNPASVHTRLDTKMFLVTDTRLKKEETFQFDSCGPSLRRGSLIS